MQIAVDQDNVVLLEEVLGWPKLELPIDLDYVDPISGMNIFHRIAKKENPDLFMKLLNSGKLTVNQQLLIFALNQPVAG